jgi:hypothetical protein
MVSAAIGQARVTGLMAPEKHLVKAQHEFAPSEMSDVEIYESLRTMRESRAAALGVDPSTITLQEFWDLEDEMHEARMSAEEEDGHEARATRCRFAAPNFVPLRSASRRFAPTRFAPAKRSPTKFSRARFPLPRSASLRSGRMSRFFSRHAFQAVTPFLSWAMWSGLAVTVPHGIVRRGGPVDGASGGPRHHFRVGPQVISRSASRLSPCGQSTVAHKTQTTTETTTNNIGACRRNATHGLTTMRAGQCVQPLSFRG